MAEYLHSTLQFNDNQLTAIHFLLYVVIRWILSLAYVLFFLQLVYQKAILDMKAWYRKNQPTQNDIQENALREEKQQPKVHRGKLREPRVALLSGGFQGPPPMKVENMTQDRNRSVCI